ncbi:lipopolysaccharide biosynthesis protein [Aurantiacibacter sp. DGU5]|uniref:Lipopolysaccharide biosynthesis protein n=2 Tax=Aurantiacibacter flavus TaxID=3145232 RepID=A0ABV0CZ85_9SPHN
MNAMLRSRIGSIMHLMSGSFAVAGIMALSTVVAARALGPEAYGVLALVLTVGRICERFIRFESWQSIIRFGTQEDVEENPQAMSELFLLGLLLDIGCAWLATALMLAGGYIALPYIGLDRSDFYLLVIFAPAIAFNITGVPTAALRMADKFKLLAYFQLFSAGLRLTMAGIAWWLGAPLYVFLAIWTVAQLINIAVFGLLAIRQLKDLGIPNPLSSGVRGLTGRFPGFMAFAWSTNASSALRTLTTEADTLLVGALAGPTPAGAYHITKRFAKVAQQVATHVQAVIYPDISRMWARRRFADVRAVTVKVQLVLGGLALGAIAVTALIGEKGLDLLLGGEYDQVYPMLITQLIAVMLIMFGAPVRSTMLAMNRPHVILIIAVLGTAVFFATAMAAIPMAGAIGANYAHIATAAVNLLFIEIFFRVGYKRHQSAVAQEPVR